MRRFAPALVIAVGLLVLAPSAPSWASGYDMLDPSFGIDAQNPDPGGVFPPGVAVSDIPGGDGLYFASMIRDSQGRISLIGETGDATWDMRRLLADGRPDKTFRKVDDAAFAYGSEHAATALADGGIAVVTAGGGDDVGDFAPPAVLVRRYTTAGALDPGFGGGDRTIGGLPGPAIGRSILELPDRKLLLGATVVINGEASWLLARLHPDGSLDQTFGDAGSAVVALPGTREASTKPSTTRTAPRSLLIAPDGTLTIAGTAVDATTGLAIGAVAKLTADGLPDPAYGNGGDALIRLAAGINTFVAGAALASDGGIAAVGHTQIAPNLDGGLAPDTDGRQMSVVRLNADGRPVSTFGMNGTRLVDFGRGTRAFGIASARGGRILVGGETEAGAAVARLLPSGALDPSFGGGRACLRVADEYAPSRAIIALPDGRALVAGTSDDPDGGDFMVARLRERFGGFQVPCFAGSDFTRSHGGHFGAILRRGGRVVWEARSPIARRRQSTSSGVLRRVVVGERRAGPITFTIRGRTGPDTKGELDLQARIRVTDARGRTTATSRWLTGCCGQFR
jgi:uncharacterized delta-60 repeat protein